MSDEQQHMNKKKMTDNNISLKVK